jgi:hypothetical protein
MIEMRMFWCDRIPEPSEHMNHCSKQTWEEAGKNMGKRRAEIGKTWHGRAFQKFTGTPRFSLPYCGFSTGLNYRVRI